MILPSEFNMRRTAFGDGAKGYAFQQSKDVDGLGVSLVATRAKHGAPWVQSWSFDWLPDRVFATFGELKDAVAELTDEAIAAEKAKYPQIEGEPKPAHHANRCQLCPRGAKKPAIIEVSISLSPGAMDHWFTPLCEDHQHLVDDVPALVALKADVAERNARATERGLA